MSINLDCFPSITILASFLVIFFLMKHLSRVETHCFEPYFERKMPLSGVSLTVSDNDMHVCDQILKSLLSVPLKREVVYHV